jgi:hypothetical protein
MFLKRVAVLQRLTGIIIASFTTTVISDPEYPSDYSASMSKSSSVQE